MSNQLIRKYIDMLNETSGSAHSGTSGSAHSGRSGSGVKENLIHSGVSGSGYSGSGHSGSGYSGSGHSGSGYSGSGHSGSGVVEKWNKPTTVNPEERGKYKGKSKAELLHAYNQLKQSGPHPKGSPEFGRMRELAFAIRAKGNWGKVS